jgi:N-acetylglucosaminyldiphosphoundecaprenol N-acetyl-beta-D-mannosaminyltransferase
LKINPDFSGQYNLSLMTTKKLLSIKITLGTYQSFVDILINQALAGKSFYACVANVHMLIEAHNADSFAAIVNNADMVTPDGKPLTWGLHFLHGVKQDRVAGMDLLPDLLAAAEKKYIPIAFYGGTDEMLNRTREHLKKNYPEIIIAQMYSPPFRPLDESEENAIIKMFNDSQAKLIFVVLGCPKQEKWMAQMKNKINAVMVGVGGALPVLVGMQKRAPLWMQNYGLEWLYRLGQEPKRLFKRYFTTNSIFIFLLLKERFFVRNKRDKKAA